MISRDISSLSHFKKSLYLYELNVGSDHHKYTHNEFKNLQVSWIKVKIEANIQVIDV